MSQTERSGFRRALDEIYPPRQPESEINPEAPFNTYLEALTALAQAPDDMTPDLLLQAKHLFDNEARRQESSENRAGTVISAAGIAGTLIVGAGSLVAVSGPLWLRLIMGGLYVVALVYLALATANALRVQRSKRRWTLGPDDLVPEGGSTPDFRRRVAAKVAEYTTNNYKVNNQQMLSLDRAQMFFRNAIVSAILTGLLVPAANALT